MDKLHLIKKLLIIRFQIEFMTLRHATQRNLAKQGTYNAWSSKETVGAANNWEFGSYCQMMSSNEIGYN